MTATAAEIARTVDHCIADAVYAAEAFVSYVREHDAVLRDVPIVLVGLSRGSFCIPALAAKLEECPAAAVLVTAGAHVVDIALRTTLLDPFRTAPALHGIPTLMIHGV